MQQSQRLVESEIISNFLNLVTLKPTCSILYLLPMHDCVALCLAHLENTGLVNHADLPHIHTLEYTVAKKFYIC